MLRKVSQTKIDEIAASLAQQKADLEKEQSAKPSAPATNGSNFLKNRPHDTNGNSHYLNGKVGLKKGLTDDEIIRYINEENMTEETKRVLLPLWKKVYIKDKVDGSSIDIELARALSLWCEKDPQRIYNVMINSPWAITRGPYWENNEPLNQINTVCGSHLKKSDVADITKSDRSEKIVSNNTNDDSPVSTSVLDDKTESIDSGDLTDTSSDNGEISTTGLHRRLTRQQMRNRPKLPMLLEDNFSRGQVGMLVGQSQSRKTFMIIQMMYDAMLGRKFLNKFQFNGNSKVLYNPGEDESSINTRLLAIEKGLTEEELAIVDNNFIFDDMVVQLATGTNVIEFIQFNKEQNIDIVVIDTFARATLGAEENSATAMGEVMANAIKIAKELNCFVLLIHHMKKDKDEIRGNSAILGALDLLYYMSWDEKAERGKIWVEKLKNQKRWESIVLEQEIIYLPDGSSSLVLHIANSPHNTNCLNTKTVAPKGLDRMDTYEIILEFAKQDTEFNHNDVHKFFPKVSASTYQNALSGEQFRKNLSHYLNKTDDRPAKFRIKEKAKTNSLITDQ